MGALFVLLLLVPTALFADSWVVREVLIGERPPWDRPSMEADWIERALARGDWAPPAAEGADQHGVVWKRVQADEDGWIRDEALTRGYAYASVNVEEEGTYVLEAMGYAGVCVNGEPRIGNVYGTTDDWESWQPPFDYSRVPVGLRRGENQFLFFGSRAGLLRARLQVAEEPIMLNPRDATLPDLVVGEAVDSWGALVVMNATAGVVTRAQLEVGLEREARGVAAGVKASGEPHGPHGRGGPVLRIDVPTLAPYCVRKVRFPIRGEAFPSVGVGSLQVRLLLEDEIVDAARLELQVKPPEANRRVTFVSKIDGSVQFYGYLPARESRKSEPAHATGNGAGDSERKALFLSLHGAAVDALNQSGSYAPLSWGHVLAPTNRRPFGFNWEDWGRLDALEVLALGLERLHVDPDRVYLTGHSMGGHGTWHVGTLHPDRFAALGPSAGWISLWTYRMEEPRGPLSPLAALVERANLPSRTLEMAPNLADVGVYVLHGADDDNVPVAQSYRMLEKLESFHRDFVFHEQPGVGHWWDLSEEPGADCVTWAPMFDFFARHRRPRLDEVRAIRFMTPSARISPWKHWVCIAAQQRPFVMSRVDLRLDPRSRRLGGTTENVATLGLNLAPVGLDSLWLELDGESLAVAVPSDGMVWLGRNGSWASMAAPDPDAKGMHRDGSFRDAFENRMQLVYATRGTPEENAWALAKARYDAEYLWYQGNASVEVLPDSLFDPAAEPERNVVLYGNADTHAHWRALWNEARASVRRGHMQIGARELSGDGWALLALAPRPGSTRSCVGIVSGTGLTGLHLLDRRPYLMAGVAYPDLTVFQDRGEKEIVRAAGFFGNDWRLESGEILWAAEP